MPETPTLLLHAGIEKTGSSTIQNFFHSHRRRLACDGVFYPLGLGVHDHRDVAIMAYDDTRHDEITAGHGIHNTQGLRAFKDRTRAKLSSELNACVKQGCEKFVLSSEHIHSRLTSESELETLREIFHELGFPDIRIVIYLREQATLAVSTYSTRIKGGGVDDGVRPTDDPYYQNLCDHQATLQRFARVFGEDSLVVRIFEKKSFVGGSLISDFFDAISESMPKDVWVTEEQENPALSAQGLESLRRINQILNKRDGVETRHRARLVQLFEKHFTGGLPYQMPIQLRKQYQSTFAEGNEWVRSRYFAKRDLLFTDIHDTGAEIPHAADTEAERVANLLADLLLGLASDNPSGEKHRSMRHRHIPFLNFLARIRTIIIRHARDPRGK